MSTGPRLTAVSGSGPVVLVAPHGGRRDAAGRPWGSERLRVNDLHTADLTVDLARLLDAPAIINGACDRNDVDLNRISEAHERAPVFLADLTRLLEATVARHGRATVLVVHGWNVVEPVVDLGVGCAPGADPFAVDGRAAVSPAFAASGLRALVDACAAHDIVTTVGARYPARHRENLLQLFTPRYRDDPRALVRGLAALAPHVDAVQLELGIPLRWPGAWRERMLAACRSVLPVLASAPGAAVPPAPPAPPLRQSPARLEFTTPTLCGLIAADARGGRLLLFPPRGGLVLFTGEWIGPERREGAGFRVFPDGAGGLAVRFRGPLLHFPDTTPFLDLEPGLATAHLVEGEVALDFAPEDGGGSGFGAISGRATLDGTVHPLAGDGFRDSSAPPSAWPRFRAALRTDDGAGVVVTVALHGGAAHGFVSRGSRQRAVASARAALGPPEAPLARVELEVELEDGERLALALRALHRLPVVRGGSEPPVRFEFAACRLEGSRPGAAGWCELGGV